jgi:peptidoglycan/xylan/chitin deacetylase (PgdA/CDA1 family)
MISNLLKQVVGTNQSSLSILVYHQVFDQRDYLHPDEPTVAEFESQMRVIREHFIPLSLSHATKQLQDGTLPRNAACITFDDGYLDNLLLAAPILKRLNIPATIFVASDFIDGGTMWNDRILEAIRWGKTEYWNLDTAELGAFDMSNQRARYIAAKELIKQIKHLPSEKRLEKVVAIEKLSDASGKQLMMSKNHLRQLGSFGIEIGAHTKSHPILTSLQEEEAEDEIRGCKYKLEDILQKNIDFFAYPNGHYGVDFVDIHKDIVRAAGFSAAVTTDWGVSSSETDLFQLPRFTPWDKQPAKFLYRLLKNTRNVQFDQRNSQLKKH